MYLEIDEGFSEHPKTLKLCSIMADPLAGFYLFNLWKWACRSCQDGNLRGLGVYEIEEAARYHRHDGKLCSAMADSGFLDRDEDGNLTRIHNWMKRTGLAIKKMSDKAEENRKRRADAKAKHDAEKSENRTENEVEPYRNRTGTIPSQTRPDQTSQDQTSPKRGEAPLIPCGKIRPRTPHDLETCLRVAIQREQPQNGPWIPGRFSTADADKMIRDLGDIEAALPTIERKIELFAKDPSMQPWTMAKFVDKWNEIGMPKLEYGRPPKQDEPKPRCTPIREW